MTSDRNRNTSGNMYEYIKQNLIANVYIAATDDIEGNIANL